MAKIKLVVSATIEETFSDFIISRKTKGLAEKTLQSYQSQFQAVARHMDVKMDIAMLQKADLDAMIISMRDASLSPNSINSYTRTLKSFFSWCNEQGIVEGADPGTLDDLDGVGEHHGALLAGGFLDLPLLESEFALGHLVLGLIAGPAQLDALLEGFGLVVNKVDTERVYLYICPKICYTAIKPTGRRHP